METLADYFVDFMHLAYEVQFHLKIKYIESFRPTPIPNKFVCGTVSIYKIRMEIII